MNPSKGFLLIAPLLIAAFVAGIGSFPTQAVKPNYTKTNLSNNFPPVLQPYHPLRRGIPQRREGGGTR